MGGTIIRRALDKDLEAILALYGELSGAYGTVAPSRSQTELWAEAMADRRQHILVAEADGEITGTLTVVVVPNLGHNGQPWAAIDNVAVAASRRRLGIGSALVEEGGRIARKHQCYKIVLSSNLVRTGAHDFYRRLGWRQTHIGFSLDL